MRILGPHTEANRAALKELGALSVLMRCMTQPDATTVRFALRSLMHLTSVPGIKEEVVRGYVAELLTPLNHKVSDWTRSIAGCWTLAGPYDTHAVVLPCSSQDEDVASECVLALADFAQYEEVGSKIEELGLTSRLSRLFLGTFTPAAEAQLGTKEVSKGSPASF